MTEHEWLTSEDPVAMYAALGPAAYRQRRLFIVAAERMWFKDNGDSSRYPSHAEMMVSWKGFSYSDPGFDRVGECLRIHSLGQQRPGQANLLREIFGNPWRGSTICGVTEGIIDLADSVAPNCSICKEILTWREGIIPAAAREIYEAEAWGDLPVFADMVEEGGCHVPTILDHFRGREVCPHCDGGRPLRERAVLIKPGGQFAEWPPNVPASEPMYRTETCCNGTGFRPANHVRGCWALELFIEGSKMWSR